MKDSVTLKNLINCAGNANKKQSKRYLVTCTCFTSQIKRFKSTGAFNWSSVTWHKSDEYVMHLSSALAQH